MSDAIALENMSDYARSVVKQLGLKPHPEGGWYRQTWASAKATRKTESGEVDRPLSTLIYFLLAQGDASAWHKVDADEIWLWHGPATVTLELGGTGESPEDDPTKRKTVLLGSGFADEGTENDQKPIGQFIIPEGCWQRTVPGKDDAVVSCVVSPGFTFNGFTLE